MIKKGNGFMLRLTIIISIISAIHLIHLLNLKMNQK